MSVAPPLSARLAKLSDDPLREEQRASEKAPMMILSEETVTHTTSSVVLFTCVLFNPCTTDPRPEPGRCACREQGVMGALLIHSQVSRLYCSVAPQSSLRLASLGCLWSGLAASRRLSTCECWISRATRSRRYAGSGAGCGEGCAPRLKDSIPCRTYGN